MEKEIDDDEITDEDLRAELSKLFEDYIPQDDEFTAPKLARELGLSRGRVFYVLKKMDEKSFMDSRLERVGGKLTTYSCDSDIKVCE